MFVFCVCIVVINSIHMPHGREERLKMVRGPATRNLLAPAHVFVYAGPEEQVAAAHEAPRGGPLLGG